MTRSLSAGMTTAVTGESGELLYLFELAFQTTTARFSTTAFNISYNAVTWTAVGGALRFEIISESGDLSASTVQLRLSGVDRAAIAPTLSERHVGRAVKVWLASLDTAKKTVIATPVLEFSGLMNGAVDIEERSGPDGRSGGTVDIAIHVMDRLGALEQHRGLRTNIASHQQLFPDDTFFASVGDMVNLQLPWGREG